MSYITFEHTDLFGGEANYCWVKREKIELPDDKPWPSTLALVRRGKKFAGFTGLRCEVLKFGDLIQIIPKNLCQTVFVIYEI